jgi:hypothetical protein
MQYLRRVHRLSTGACDAMSADRGELRRALASGQFRLGVDPAFARRLFLTVPSSALKLDLGTSLAFQRSALWVVCTLAHGFLVLSVGLAVLKFSWWAIPAVLLTSGLYICWTGISSMGAFTNRFSTVVAVLLAVLLLSQLNVFPLKWVGFWMILNLLFMISVRLVYFLAASFMRRLILTNDRAVEALAGGFIIRP